MPDHTSSESAHRFPISSLHHFSSFDRAFTARADSLSVFLGPPPAISALEAQIREKADTYLMRDSLCRSLEIQYAGMDMPQAVSNNLMALRNPGTFTVTTAHQPLLFGGKLYVLYKAVSTILLARRITEATGATVVPIFVMGSEDHDLEEVRYFKPFSSRLAWEPEGQGPLGRKAMFNINELLSELEKIFRPLPFGDYALTKLQEAYRPGDTFAGSFRKLLHSLLGSLGLIILDPDDAELKRGFSSTVKEELFNGFSIPLVNKAIDAIEAHGFRAQAHPRDINLFYLEDGIRARIERSENGNFHALDTSLVWTKAEMEELLDRHPERFSPNVILRPVYQETILPNLAFVGGGGELAYWIQLREVFRARGISFPLLVRRQSACLADESTRSRMHKLGLDWEDLSSPIEENLKDFVKSLENEPVDLTVERAAVVKILEGLRVRAGQIDPTLQRSLDATEHQIIKQLEAFEARMVRGLKHRHENEVQQFRNLFEKVHPNQGLQERQEEFMTWLARYGPEIIDILLANTQPMDPDFVYLDV